MSLTRFTLLAALLLFSVSLGRAVETLELDADASKIEFVGKKADGKHEGGFKKFTSKAVANFEEPTKGTLEIEIDATSLWADDEKLANHLKNPDFFDVRKYPKITFKSTGIVHGDDEARVVITGNWTMLDKTVQVEIPCAVVNTEKSIEVNATFVIDRTKWGMTYGEGKVNNDVDVKAHLVFNR